MRSLDYLKNDNEFEDTQTPNPRINENDYIDDIDNENYGVDENYVEDEDYDEAFNTYSNNPLGTGNNIKEPESKGIMETIKKFATFSSILRISGALIVIASMITFLFKGWTDGDDVERYYMLLTQTFSLALGGFALSYILKENKGARVFFGLGLLSVIVNMTILGALIFSTTQWGSNLATYASFATWKAVDFGSLGLVIAASLAIMLPVAIFSFMIFARNSAKSLTLLFVISNVLLLIPVRESIYVGIIAVIGALLPIIFIRKNIIKDTSLRTAEGYFAITTLFLPLLIIAGRSVWIYQIDTFLQLILSVIGFALLHVTMTATEEQSFGRSILEWISVILSASIAITSAELINPLVAAHIGLPIVGIVFAGFTFFLAKSSSINKINFSMIAGIVLATCNMIQIFSTGGFLSTILCVSSGIALVYIGLKMRNKILLTLGSITAISGLGHQIIDFVRLIDLSDWTTLAIIGVSAIVIASVLERHGAVIKLKLTKLLQIKK